MNEQESLATEREAFAKEKEDFAKERDTAAKEKKALEKEELDLEKQALDRKVRLKWGFGCFVASILIFLISYFFIEPGLLDHSQQSNVFSNWKAVPVYRWHPLSLFLLVVLLIASILLIFDFSRILFDPEEYTSNTFKRAIIRKIRYRAVLFNNIAIILFLLTLIVIGLCFYLFFQPTATSTSKENEWVNNLTVRLGASILLIFLVQILFKVFKYLLRVAAFYNARADAIEYLIIDQKGELEKLMNLFTPEKYDISELEKVSIWDGVTDVIKSKIGK